MHVRFIVLLLMLNGALYGSDVDDKAPEDTKVTLIFVKQNAGSHFCLRTALSPFIIPGKGIPNRYDVSGVIEAVENQFEGNYVWASRLNKVAVESSWSEIQGIIEQVKEESESYK